MYKNKKCTILSTETLCNFAELDLALSRVVNNFRKRHPVNCPIFFLNYIHMTIIIT